MTGMIIADDELLIRQGLQSISWSDYGIEVRGLASNGMEALSLIECKAPEILLTDIRMPGMDGLKLIHAAKKIIPDIKTILLTGYEDFNYAHTAIQLGAIGYILKPSNPNEIINMVLMAKEQIDAEMNEKLEKEKIRQQIDSMQDIIFNTFLADKPESEEHEASAKNELLQVKNAVVKNILEYIEKHFMQDISLITVSEYVFMNHIYLSRLIKKETGENFLEILTRTRLRKACEMLKDCNLKTYEIADMVGIKDSGYFSQVFRKYFGMTPSEYRENVLSDKRMKA